MLKIRQFHDHLIFNMGIPIPGKDGLHTEADPRASYDGFSARHLSEFCLLVSVKLFDFPSYLIDVSAAELWCDDCQM